MILGAITYSRNAEWVSQPMFTFKARRQQCNDRSSITVTTTERAMGTTLLAISKRKHVKLYSKRCQKGSNGSRKLSTKVFQQTGDHGGVP